MKLDYQVFRLTTVTTRIIYKKGLKTLTTRIVYKIRGSSFLKKNLNLEWIKNEHRSNPFLYIILVVIVWGNEKTGSLIE